MCAAVTRSPAATVFHHPAWLRLLRTTYRYEMTACVVLGDEGTPLAGVPVAALAGSAFAASMT